MNHTGLGNLIALPLQKTAREKFNSEFIDEHFQSYMDQWAFLSTIQRIPLIDDVLNNYHQGRNCIVLSLRTAHVESLAKRLKEKAPDVFALMGGMGKKATREIFQGIADIPAGRNIILVATGHFIGEGFDELRLDTLFLAMPISWKGTLQQYAGRLHRLYKAKKEVKIYDYVDIQVKMLEKMYQKRLNGYAFMGYKVKGEELNDTPLDIIFDKDNFLPVFNQDINAVKKEILIVSPFVRKIRTHKMTKHQMEAASSSISHNLLLDALCYRLCHSIS